MPTQPHQHDFPRVPSSPSCRGPWRNANEKNREQNPKTLESLQIEKKVQQTEPHIRFIVQPVVYDDSTAMSLQIALVTAYSPNEGIYCQSRCKTYIDRATPSYN